LARILFVEDEEFWRTFIKEQLRGHHVDAVATYQEAVGLLESESAYAVALVDLNLHGDDDGEGGELLDLLLWRYPSTKRIVVTGNMPGGAVLKRIITRYDIEELIIKRNLRLPDLRRTVEEAIAAKKPGELPQSLRLDRSTLQQRSRAWQSLQSDRLEVKLHGAEDHLADVRGIRGQVLQEAQAAVGLARQRLARFHEVVASLQPIVMNINSQADFDLALAAQDSAEEEFSDHGGTGHR
jgi:CheY-like chemotaxis protein